MLEAEVKHSDLGKVIIIFNGDNLSSFDSWEIIGDNEELNKIIEDDIYYGSNIDGKFFGKESTDETRGIDLFFAIKSLEDGPYTFENKEDYNLNIEEYYQEKEFKEGILQ